jgi:hypothetical protein
VRAALLAVVATLLAACQTAEKVSSSAHVNCAKVGEVLAMYELGRDAKPDTRASVIAKHRTACEEQHVTADEQACLFKAKDTWSARACLPRMFSQPAPPGEKPSCATAIARWRAAVSAQLGTIGSAAADQLDKILPIAQLSCEQDHWPDNVLACIAATQVGDMATFQACSSQLSPELQKKLTDRIAARLQEKQ